MSRKRSLIAGALVVLVAVALYGGLVLYPRMRLHAALRAAASVLPAGSALTYRSAGYALLSGRASLSDVRLRLPGPLGLEIAIRRLVLVQPNAALAAGWQRAVADPSAIAPTAALPVAARVAARGISLRTRTLRETIGAAEVANLRLYPWALLHPGLPSWAAAQAILAARPPPRSLAALRPLLRLESAWVLGVGYTSVSAETIAGTVEIPPQPGLPARTTSFHIARSTGPDNDRGVFGPGRAEQIRLDLGPPAGTILIARIAIAGMTLRKPLGRLLEAAPLTGASLDGLTIGGIEVSGMARSAPTGPPIPLGTFALSHLAFARSLPVSASLAWTGVRLTRAEMPSPLARLAFQELGLDTITVGLRASYDWNLAQHIVSLHGLGLTLAELGALDGSASLTDVTPGRAALASARLSAARLRYTDASLIARALRIAGSFMHTDPTRLRDSLIAMVQARAAAFRDSPALTAAAAAVIAFLRHPHSLTVSLSPAAPVPLATLRDAAAVAPPDLAALLGLTVTANR